MLNGETSFHHFSIGDRTATRPSLPGDCAADVCIVGAGYTGLWAAWWLRETTPDLSIVVIDANRVGFGASGRNLGWISGKPVGHRGHLAKGPAGLAGPVDLRRACVEAVTEIPGLMAAHGIEIDAAHGGYLQVALNAAGLRRVARAVADRESWGFGEEDLRLLDREETLARVRIEGALGGLYSPHCVRVQPQKLAQGLAKLVEARGVTIYEATPALAMVPRAVATPSGTIRARIVLRAIEAYNTAFPGHRRDLMPLRSSVIATEPLPAAAWNHIGWDRSEGIYGAEHTSFFATRTADGRIILSGRGVPYHYGSVLDENGRLDGFTVRHLARRLRSLFPAIEPVIAHAWCGVYGVARDWSPSVGFDRTTGFGHAGGYVGQGVAASYVAGRTLADLVAGRESRWTRLPWTSRVSPLWPPEPGRFVGFWTAYGLYRSADAMEGVGGSRTAFLAKIATAVSGRP